MDRVRFPGTDIEISALCLGVAEIGVRQTEIEAHRLLDYWVQHGGNCVDTARVYSDWIPGEKHRSERIVGDWLRAAGVREPFTFGVTARFGRQLGDAWNRLYRRLVFAPR